MVDSRIKHNMSYSRLYRIWKNMKSRIYNPKHDSYHNYGGRGLIICEEWHKFEPFMKWALSHGYTDELTIERINNESGYSPENCKWITWQEQNWNIRGRGSSKYRGVWYDKARNKYGSRVVVDGKTINLGRFKTEYEAALAYDVYCIKNSVKRTLNVLGA